MSLDVLRNCIINDSIMHGFYCSIFNSSTPKPLVNRVKAGSHLNNINMLRYILNDKYYSNSKRLLTRVHHIKPGTDGLVDSLRHILDESYDVYDRNMCKLLLKPF